MPALLLFTLADRFDPRCAHAEHDGIVYQGDDDRPVTGLMATTLGARIPAERLRRDDLLEGDEDSVLALVRAYPVVALVGTRLTCTRDSDLAARLAALLDERCPGVAWRVEGDRLVGPLRKYGLLHTSVDAPQDETTGQPMALELYGEVVELDGSAVESGAGWVDAWRNRQGPDYDLVEIVEPFTVELRAATYANVLYPGDGVSFYM